MCHERSRNNVAMTNSLCNPEMITFLCLSFRPLSQAHLESFYMCSSSFFKKKKVRLFWGFYISRAYSLLALFFENESVSWLHKYSIVCMNHNMFNYSPNVEYADWVLVINNSSKISSIGLIPYFSQPAYCSGSLSCVVNSMVLLHSDFQLVLANLGARQSDYVFP